MRKTRVYERYKCCQDGCEDVENYERLGHLAHNTHITLIKAWKK